MALDINRLTLGEVAKIEELSKQPISAIGDDDTPKGLALAAMAFVAKKREDPKFTWNAAQDLTFDEVTELLGMNVDEAEEDNSEENSDSPLDNGSETPNRATRRAAPKGKAAKK